MPPSASGKYSPPTPECSQAGHDAISPSASVATSIVSWPPAFCTARGQNFEKCRQDLFSLAGRLFAPPAHPGGAQS
jgi:hypothetical protein